MWSSFIVIWKRNQRKLAAIRNMIPGSLPNQKNLVKPVAKSQHSSSREQISLSMKSFIWSTLVILLANFSCIDKEDPLSKYLLDLDQLRSEIVALSESVSCTNSDEWKFTPMGTKTCGGPERYIAYHQSVEKRFLELVGQYTFQQGEYQRKNDVVSDCMQVVAPRTVSCEGGKAVLVY